MHKILPGAARWFLPDILPAFLEVLNLSSCRRRCVWGSTHAYVPSYCPANARQPEAPLTPNRRPPPLCLPLLFEKPKGDPTLEINLFRSLSARLPSLWLFPGCSDIRRPGHVLRGRPRSHPPTHESDSLLPHPSGATDKRRRCLCFHTDSLPSQKKSSATW